MEKIDESETPLTFEILESLGFKENKSKQGRRFTIWVDCEQIDLVYYDFLNGFFFRSYTHAIYRIESIKRIKDLVFGLTGKEVDAWK